MKSSLSRGICALFLSIGLALPGPALALRQAELSENQFGMEKLKGALGPAVRAGAEESSADELAPLRELISQADGLLEQERLPELEERLKQARAFLKDWKEEALGIEDPEAQELEGRLDWLEAQGLMETLFDKEEFDEGKAYRTLELLQRALRAPGASGADREFAWRMQALILSTLVGDGLLKEEDALRTIMRQELPRKTVFILLQNMFFQQGRGFGPGSGEFAQAMAKSLAYGLMGLLLPEGPRWEEGLHLLVETVFLRAFLGFLGGETAAQAGSPLREILPSVHFRSPDEGNDLIEDLLKPDWRAVYEVVAVAADILADVADRLKNQKAADSFVKLRQIYLRRLSRHPGFSSYVRGRIVYQKAGVEEALAGRMEQFALDLRRGSPDGLTPVVIGAGLEQAHPELRVLGRLKGLPVLFAAGLEPDQVVVELITRWNARAAVFAGTEEEAGRFIPILSAAGIEALPVTPETPGHLILAIVARAAGMEERDLAGRAGRFLDDVEAFAGQV